MPPPLVKNLVSTKAVWATLRLLNIGRDQRLKLPPLTMIRSLLRLNWNLRLQAKKSSTTPTYTREQTQAKNCIPLGLPALFLRTISWPQRAAQSFASRPETILRVKLFIKETSGDNRPPLRAHLSLETSLPELAQEPTAKWEAPSIPSLNKDTRASATPEGLWEPISVREFISPKKVWWPAPLLDNRYK